MHIYYSLEKSHIIQGDYSIECCPTIPGDLYDHLGLKSHCLESPFTSCPEYVQRALDIANDVKYTINFYRCYTN